MESFNSDENVHRTHNTQTGGGGFTGFGRFLVGLKTHLTTQNIQVLTTALDLKPAERDKVDVSLNPGYTFVHLLREKGIISSADVSTLTGTLKECDLHGVADEVDNLFKRYSEQKNHSRESQDYGHAGDASEAGQINLFGTSDFQNGTEVIAQSRLQLFNTLCEKLGISKHGTEKLTQVEGMIVRPAHFTGEDDCNVFHSFIEHLTSHDYRVQQVSLSSKKEACTPEEMSSSRSWTDVASLTITNESERNGVSSRDITYVILHCLDPFLRQDVLTKMAACQLAVPILFVDVKGSQVTMLLWGLRKICKSWCDDSSISSIREEVVVKFPFISIAALRIGEFPASKSNILNKVLGPAQNNDDHAFFTSFEQDSCSTVLSEGTLECVWFLPGNEEGLITSPFLLLNLRGDALKFTSQANFAKELSLAVIVFIDSALIKSYQNHIEEIASHSYVIVVIYQKDRTGDSSKTFTAFKYPLTLVFSGGMSALEIGREISKGIHTAIKGSVSIKKRSLESAVDVAKKFNFKVDEEDEDCSKAKELAMVVKDEIRKYNPEEFKLRYFCLHKLWKTWSSNERRRSWTTAGYLEHEQALHEEVQGKLRREQARINIPDHLQSICDLLLNKRAAKRHYFISWLEIYLNEEAVNYLKPLTEDLTKISSDRRNLSNEIHQLESDLRNQKGTAMDQNKLQHLKQKEKDINSTEGNLIKKFDENVLGLEHFIREFGQLVESYHYSSMQTRTNSTYIKLFPKVVAKMLLGGQPLEILDGDTSHVPLMWLKAVFRELASILGKYVKLYVISVLGIQSSGKSTLLNSMFGVRFATSAGRCTRGVFLQLLPVEKSLAQKLQCDFIAIVDTEGLRAPGKSLSPSTEQDNELATFALCISDLTLINIGGQTMGDDMMNVLQIAAHAFVRMKEVDLSPQCRIVQQFVADVTAEQKNESAMQTIIMKLDEAACEAAKREGKEHIYRQFTDIFTLQNYESDVKNVQYIPSLWRGFMAAPDYQYSIRVQKLKSTILQSIPTEDRTGLTLLEFQQRITDVWTAILKEDFVFSFQNTKEVSLYQEVILFYRAQIQPLRQELLEMELSAKNAIARSKSTAIDSSVDNWILQVNNKLASACDRISEILEFKFREKRYLIVRKYSGCFHADLKTFQANIWHNISTTLRRNADLIKSEHKKSSVAEQMKKEIHDSFAQFAQILRSITEKKLQRDIPMESTDEIIESAFNKKWIEMLEEVGKENPLKSLEETQKEIKTTLINQILREVAHTDLQKYCTEFLESHISTYSLQFGRVGNHDIKELKLRFSDIANDRNNLFEKVVSKIKNLAKNHRHFEINAMEALRFLKLQLQKDFSDSNWNVIILHLCSMFVTESHNSQQMEEIQLILCNQQALEEVCAKGEIISKQRIPSELSHIILEEFFTPSESWLILNTKLQLQHESKQLNLDNVEQDWFFQRVLNFVKQQPSTMEWFSDYFERLKDLLVNLEERYGGKLSTGKLMKAYAKDAKKLVDKRNLSTERQRLDAIKLTYNVGVERFMEAFNRCLERRVQENNYVLKYAEPLHFRCLQTKVAFMAEKINQMFSQMVTLEPQFSVGNVLQFSALPHVFSILQKLDPLFVNMIPQITPKEMYSVISVLNEVKCSILSHAKPKTDFNPESFVQHIGELIQNTNDFSKQMQASAIVHIAAWALPIYAKCQYDYERDKNITYLLQKDEKVFRTEFKSLSSNCQDEVIAEIWFDVMKNAILDGIVSKLYPLLYASSLNTNYEFRTKKIFIGSILKDLFTQENYQGISDLLHNFQTFSQNWILKFHAKQYNKNPSFLHSKLKSCFDSLIDASKESIQSVATSFEGTDFSEWITSCTSSFEKTTKLSCDQNKVETIRKYLKITDFQLLSKCCIKLLDAFKNSADVFDKLPDVNDEESIKAWMIDDLPKQLHVDILDSFKGCNSQCPFCGTVCDHNLTEHPKHESMSHFPSGLKGWRNRYSKRLSISICNFIVESKKKYKIPGSDNDECRPYREYELDFPDWKIRGQTEGEPTKFWKRIFVLFNSSLAEKYACKKGDIPPMWKLITHEEALTSLCEAYNL